jgi:hypothetical protein
MQHKKLGMLIAALVALSSILLAGCGNLTTVAQVDQPAATTQSSTENHSNVSNVSIEERKAQVTPIATRTADPSPVSSVDAATALTTWNNQTLGIGPTIMQAKGMTTQVYATYDIVTAKSGVIQANIEASRAAYSGQIQNGGASILLLGGGSDLSKQSLDVQIKSASLGYTQLPTATFPTSSSAALSELKQAFPDLSSYTFHQVQTGKNSYSYYATSSSTVRGQTVQTGVSIGVIKIGNKTWNYALVGTGDYALKII